MRRISAKSLLAPRATPGWPQSGRSLAPFARASREDVGSAGRRARRRDADPEAAPQGTARRDEALARLEAVLFVAGEPLGSRRLASLASLADGTEARTLIHRLNRLYDEERS